MKLTGWYRGDQKPVRVGVYQRKYEDWSIRYCWWDGTGFGWGYDSPQLCESVRMYWGYSKNKTLPWRGVSK